MAVPEGATKLGTVGIAYKGVYDELVTYKYANAVYYNGSTYIALIDNPAGFPSNDGVNWRYLAQGFLQQAVSALTVIDESGILGEVDAEVNAQEFLSKIAELEQGLEDTKANKADILDTLEEIVANKEGGRIAGANAVSELNSNFSDIGKSCCFQQSNTTNITNAFCPVDIQSYNDDANLYKADGGGVLITKPGTYVVQASFHILFAGGDSVTVRLVNSISELVNTQYRDTNEGNNKQFAISLSKIIRIQSGQERVLLQLLSNNGNSYIFDKNSTNMNRISITKIG